MFIFLMPLWLATPFAKIMAFFAIRVAAMSDAELLAGLGYIAGAILTFAFSYFPWLNTWYAGLAENAKKWIMIGMLVLASLIVLGGACGKIWSWVTCDQAGVMQLLWVLVNAAISNQVIYKLSPTTKGVTAAKAASK